MVDQQATKRGRKPGKRKIARRVRHRNRIVWRKRVVDAHRLHYPLPKLLEASAHHIIITYSKRAASLECSPFTFTINQTVKQEHDRNVLLWKRLIMVS